MLTEAERKALVETARRSMEAEVRGAGALHVPHALVSPPAAGVFVTLKLRGELRGCLGTLDAPASLAQAVAQCAADSARRDPRFPPVTAGELAEVTVEVSVLGPLERLDPPRPDAIDIGCHGLVVEDGRRRGLLLPQVAREWGWSPEEFLRQTCRKARLAEDAWRRGALVYRFEADVFGE